MITTVQDCWDHHLTSGCSLIPTKHDQARAFLNLRPWGRRMCAPNWKVHCRTRSSALQLRFQVSILSRPRDVAAYTVWLPPPRLNPGSKRKAISDARPCTRPALEPGLGSATEAVSRLLLLRALGGGDHSWAGTSFLHRRTTKQPGSRL